MTPCDVKFYLPQVTGLPDELRQVTMMMDSIPRIGELVELRVRGEGCWQTGGGRVVDVCRSIRHFPPHGLPDQKVDVFLQ